MAPRLHKMIPDLTKVFEEVFVHNLEGDGYLIEGADRSKLRKLYYPIAFNAVIDKFWKNDTRLALLEELCRSHDAVF